MTSHQNCDLCVSGSETSKIIGYCNDCKGYVCAICYQTHTKAKAFRHHAIDKGTTVKQSADKDVASFVNLDIHEQICKQHSNEKTSLFCRKHMVVICGRCLMQKHMNCEKQLVDLTEVSHPSINHSNKIIHELEEILIDAQCLEQKVRVSKENNNSAKEENFNAARNFRKDIDNYLDKLQSNVENEITQCHAKTESILTAQLKTCLGIKETALMKQQQIDSIVQKNLKSTLYVTTETFGTEIATLKQTLDEASRKPMGPLYEFKKNDVIQNLILTGNVLGTIEDIHTGSDEVTQTITREQKHLQEKQPLMTCEGSAGNTAPREVIVPQVEEQKSFISYQIQRPLIKGENWYVLGIKWFKQWKSYVGYDSWDNQTQGDEFANPGPIDNSPLLEEDTKTLKEHLQNDLDYTLVPSKVWTAMVSWYSITDNQEPLPRQVIEEGVYTKYLKVEVYRRQFKLCQFANPNDHILKEFSRSDTIGNLKMEMMQLFNIKSDIECRLWNGNMTNMYEPLNKEDGTLQDAGLYPGQVVMIEQKNKNGTWPRCNQLASDNGARDFQPTRRPKKKT